MSGKQVNGEPCYEIQAQLNEPGVAERFILFDFFRIPSIMWSKGVEKSKVMG